MRMPDFEIDGWSLEDGEKRHRQAPGTFWIPTPEVRRSLSPGDFAKLIFRISLDDPNDPESVERMWVVVRERIGDIYLGILDNEPSSIGENEELWLGTELPFRAEHIIDIGLPTAESVDLAQRPPRRAWPR